MNIARKLGATLCAAILSFSLFSLAWVSVATATIRDRETVKAWVQESGLYDKVVDIVLYEAKAKGEGASADLPINDPQIQAVAKDAFSPEFLRQTVEKMLDDSYSWLDGSTQNLSFNIDFTDARQKLATGLGKYAETKAAALPVCATNETGENFDAFNAVCRPRSLSAAAAGQQVTSELLTSQEFLKDPVITADDIKVKDSQGKEISLQEADPAKAVRKSYQLSSYAPAILAVVALASAGGVIFLSRTKLRGMRRTGYVLVSTGIILGIGYWVLGALYEVAKEAADKQDGTQQALRELLRDILQAVASDIRGALLVFTLIYLGLGIGLIVGGIVLQKRAHPHDSTEDKKELPGEEPEVKQVVDKEPKPKTKPPKIQL